MDIARTFWNRKNLFATVRSFASDGCLRRYRALLILVLYMGGLICGLPVRISAQGPSPDCASSHVYLYQPNGAPPLDVTDTYNAHGYVYDPNGNPMYITVDYTTGHVYDSTDALVGFVS